MDDVTRIKYPARWSEPLDPDMDAKVVDVLMSVAPFTTMNPDSFSEATPLSGILKNDSRLHDLEKGDIIVREGDYGGSAFLIVSGEALVSTKSLPPEVLGRVKAGAGRLLNFGVTQNMSKLAIIPKKRIQVRSVERACATTRPARMCFCMTSLGSSHPKIRLRWVKAKSLERFRH